jgi:regulatory protein
VDAEEAGASGDAGASGGVGPGEEAAFQLAVRLLAHRGRSRQQLAQALARRQVAPEVVEAVLTRLTALGYLDDARLAGARARSLLERGRLAPEGVQARLEAQGVSAPAARAAVEAAGAELGVEPHALARRLLEGKGLLGRPLSPRELGQAGRLLLSRGFPEEEVPALLARCGLDPSQDGS